MMKLISPTLNIEQEANEKLVQEVIEKLPDKDDPFAILAKTELSYIQTLWTKEGYIIEYQVESINNHYISVDYFSQTQVVQIFNQYLSSEDSWHQKYEFIKKDIGGFWGNIGFMVGNFFGSFVRGFKEARKNKEKT